MPVHIIETHNQGLPALNAFDVQRSPTAHGIADPLEAVAINISALPEALSDAEVDTRFNVMIAGIDTAYDMQQEEVLTAQPVRKTKGSAEAFSMWKP